MATTKDTRAESEGAATASLLRLATLGALSGGVFLLGLAIAGYVNTGFYSRYLADDFCIAGHVNQRGLLDAQIYWYENWTGRFGYVFLSNLIPWLGQWSMPFYAPVLIAAMIAATVWACYQIGYLLFDASLALLSSLVGLAIVFGYLALMPGRLDGLYWLSGGTNYSGPLPLFALSAGLMAWGVRDGGRPYRVAWFAIFVLTFVSSGFAETFIVWQLALLFIIPVLAVRLEPGERRERLFELIRNAMLGALSGAAVVIFSPGNETRQGTEGPTGEIGMTVERSITDSFELLGELFWRPEAWLLAGVVLVVTAALTARSSIAARFTPGQLAVRIAVVLVTTYILLVATHAPGYYFLGGTPPARALAMGALAVVLGALAIGYLIGHALAPHWAKIETRPTIAGPLAALCLLGIGWVVVPQALREFSRTEELSTYAAAWDDRDRELIAAARDDVSDVRVKLLAHDSRLELRTDSTAWMNQCAAGYYGIRRITAE